MPTFQALQCAADRCRMFQVQQVKKVSKWVCKLCGEKQSVLRIFCEGAAKECRQVVQDLNMRRGQREGEVETRIVRHLEEISDNDSDVQRGQTAAHQQPKARDAEKSKWNLFVDAEQELSAAEDDENQNDGKQYGLAKPETKPRQTKKRVSEDGHHMAARKKTAPPPQSFKPDDVSWPSSQHLQSQSSSTFLRRPPVQTIRRPPIPITLKPLPSILMSHEPINHDTSGLPPAINMIAGKPFAVIPSQQNSPKPSPSTTASKSTSSNPGPSSKWAAFATADEDDDDDEE